MYTGPVWLYTVSHIYPLHITVWHGVMFIRQGLYQGGVYRFQLFIPDTYPDADCPVSSLTYYQINGLFSEN